MQFLMLVCAGSDFRPPDTIGPQTETWVARAETEGGRSVGGRLRPPSEAVVLGPDGDAVTATPGPRVSHDEQIVGFDVIDCPDLDSAIDLVRSHPMARAGRTELRAIWDGAP